MKFIAYLLCLTISSVAFATDLSDEVNGVYHLGTPERGAQKVMLQYGELNGKKVIAVAACKGCPPAVYSYQEEPSKELNTPVFMTAGLYLLPYNKDSFIIVQPDGLLGRKVWNKIGHANIYSKSPKIANSTQRPQIEQFAIALSKKIMSQEVGEIAHSSGTYYLAVPQNHLGKATSTYQIELITEPKKQINITPCERCTTNQFKHLSQESGIVGVDIYRHASSYYLFDLKDGVLIYTFANAGGLGKVEWGKSNQYNVYSNNQNYIRQILQSKQKQNIIDKLMAEYFKKIKQEFERMADEKNQQQIAQRELPKAGKQDGALNSNALAAAKRWASAWAWKETLKSAYITSNDWSITRNPLTGNITGRNISGVVTMTHPDGRCRLQWATFREEFDGSNYMNFHMTGVGPIYDLKCDKLSQ